VADKKKRLPSNVAGAFYVDSTCIDCDACRQIAPSVFAEDGQYSAVKMQPASGAEESAAWHALLACPVGSIGCEGKNRAAEFASDFPLLLDLDVYYCGFNSRDSYGGNSYFVVHPDGNWLIDSPRFVKSLAERFEQMGGIKYIFLSHRDDVADADKYAAHFASKRIIHQSELSAQPDAEIVLSGNEPQLLHDDFLVVPTSGHTLGHCVLLYKNKYLFTGDHLAWDREQKTLEAFKDYCWYSWAEQKVSMRRLLDYTFEWVLPGHGQRVQLPADLMKQSLARLVDSM
jgi:glyoxylase-like metal-dependent hydrolase (beta-lactamase superfamily II)/ferredoxin